MESILGLLLGIAGGGGAGFFIVRSLLVRSNQKKVDEINQISDLELEKAKLAAKTKLKRLFPKQKPKMRALSNKKLEKQKTISTD